MEGSFLGFGPAHWITGVFLWLVIIALLLGLYFAIRNKSKHDD